MDSGIYREDGRQRMPDDFSLDTVTGYLVANRTCSLGQRLSIERGLQDVGEARLDGCGRAGDVLLICTS
jgi:hypothetical protein